MTTKRKKLISAVLLTTLLLVVVFSSSVSFVQAIAAGSSFIDSRDKECGDYAASKTSNTTDPDGSELKRIYNDCMASGVPKAGDDANSTENSIANVFAWIVFYIATFFSWLVNLLIIVMVKVASYNHFLDNQIVINGWAIVRDVANNFFIVILLAIAVGTILRVPNYNRQLLPKLLVMAVLINFSKTFTGIMIDGSQVLTLWFAGTIQGVSSGGNIILLALGLDKLYRIDAGQFDWTEPVPGSLSPGAAIKTLLFALILSVVAVVVIAIITIILVYRIVMLWFLIILSPLAYLLTTFPKGQQYAGMWWSEITKYLVVGPIMLFFLYLSFFSGSINVQDPSTISSGKEGAYQVNDGASILLSKTDDLNKKIGLSELEDPVNVFDFLIIIGLMVGSLVFGQKTGVAGAQWAGKGVAGLQKWGKKAAIGTVAGTAGLAGAGVLAGAMAIPLARKIPILGRLGGQAVDKRQIKLATTKAKAEQERITTRASALKVDDMSEKDLRSLATKGDKYAKIAATQAMMKQGMFRDDDTANRAENIKLINDAKKMLPPELAATFMDNTKKYNPGLAYDTVYMGDDGKTFRTDAFTSDVRTGKVKAHEMMGSLSETQLLSLNDALAPKGSTPKGDELATFMAKHTKEKDESEMYSDLTDKQKTAIYGKVDHNTFERDGSGKLTDSGEKMRDRFNKATSFNHVMQTFDQTNTDDVDSIRTFVSNNSSDIGKKMKEVSEEFVKSFGDLVSPNQFKDQSPIIKKKLSDSFEAVINKITEAEIATGDKLQYQRTFKNALASGASFNEVNIADSTVGGVKVNAEKRAILQDVMATVSAKDAEFMKGLNRSGSQMEIAGEKMNINVIKTLSTSTEGGALASKIATEVRRQAVGTAPASTEQKRADQLKDI
ncbi:MAG: hypothetical protein Q7K65_00300 [Candidatus Buchananbacteria bacterium]|nr:hypothetical protein [Candidatus Buchananbacteria bacterium]